MTLKLCSIAAAVALAFATAAQAQQTPRTDPSTRTDRPSAERKTSDRQARRAEEDRIEAQYKAAKEKCDAMQGNAQDVCEKEAKAQENIAKAELRARANPSQRNQRRVAEARAEGEYQVAKERCDDQKGEAKDACEKDAKAKHEQARAQISKQYAQRRDAERPRPSASTGETRQPSGAGTAGSTK